MKKWAAFVEAAHLMTRLKDKNGLTRQIVEELFHAVKEAL